MASNNTSNAPMPAASGAAETFDSTIAPPESNVSSIGLPGPQTTEGPIHAGMVNAVDPFFQKQYVALQQFTWTTSQDPATLLFTVPIHPKHSHQWMRYLSEMYNTYAGGFDFAFKVAGTGFHAGAIIIVRLPPNIEPNTIRTLADLTAFEYFVIDPKTLEVEIKSVMDQRNIMYHWLGNFDIKDPNTFGGHICAYVMMPLNTSSTGATSIQVQVWTKPSPDFMFAQIKPLSLNPTPEHDIPDLIEEALDFTGDVMPAMCNGGWTDTLVLNKNDTATYTTINVVKADGTTYAATPLVAPMCYPSELYPAEKPNPSYKRYAKLMTTSGIETSIGADKKCGFKFPGESNQFIEFQILDSVTGERLKSIPTGGGTFTFDMESVAIIRVTWQGTFSKSGENIRFTIQTRISNGTVDTYKYFNSDEVPLFKDGQALMDNKNAFKSFIVDLQIDSSMQNDYAWSPPITEALVSPRVSASGRQFYTVQNLFASKKLTNWLLANEAIFLELIDEKAALPIGKFKLYFEGFMTGPNPQSNISYDLTQGRYRFKFLHKGPANTPLMSRRDYKYARNAILANLM